MHIESTFLHTENGLVRLSCIRSQTIYPWKLQICFSLQNLSAKVTHKVSLSENNEDIKTGHKSQTNTQTPDIDSILNKTFK